MRRNWKQHRARAFAGRMDFGGDSVAIVGDRTSSPFAVSVSRAMPRQYAAAPAKLAPPA